MGVRGKEIGLGLWEIHERVEGGDSQPKEISNSDQLVTGYFCITLMYPKIKLNQIKFKGNENNSFNLFPPTQTHLLFYFIKIRMLKASEFL